MAVALPGDTDNNLLKKIADNTNAITSGGGGAASNVSITGISVTLPVSGPLTDTQLRASAVPISVASLPLPSGAATEATLSALNGKITACNTGAVVLAAGAAAIGSVSVTGSVTVTGGLTDTQLRASAVPISVASLPLPSGAATEATLSTLNGKVTACNTGAVVISSGTTVVTQSTAANLKVDLSGTAANSTAIKVDGSAVTQPVSGNVGGKTTTIKDTTAVSTTPAYSDGDCVGALRTLANAVTTSGGTGILESITILDRANQKAGVEIYLFDANPTGATITDNAAFVFSTDDLKVIGRVSVAPGDYVTHNSKATATIKGIGLALKLNATTSMYAAVVLNGSTPTYAATTDVQITFGILQD